MDEFYQSVHVNGQIDYKLSAIFSNNTLNLTIFKDREAWNVLVSHEELIAQSDKYARSGEEYYKNLKKYIGDTSDNIELKFVGSQFSINLLLQNKMRRLYFQVQLHKVDLVDSAMSLLDIIYNQKVQYFNELTNLKAQHASVILASETMERKMNEFLDRRKSDEKKLYNKFIGILNEKKRHIQHLNDLLFAFRQGRPTVNGPQKAPTKRKGNDQKNVRSSKKRIIQVTSDTSSDSDTDEYHTDNEREFFNKQAETERNEPMPSTSTIEKQHIDELLIESRTVPIIFPRRIRSGENFKVDTILSKEGVTNSLKEETATQEEDVSPGPSNMGLERSSRKMPTVNFSTQDLLDNI